MVNWDFNVHFNLIFHHISDEKLCRQHDVKQTDNQARLDVALDQCLRFLHNRKLNFALPDLQVDAPKLSTSPPTTPDYV